jgi:hypothetical protein
MAFIDQVQDLTGLTVGDNEELSEWLRDGVLDVTLKVVSIDPSRALEFQRVSAATTANNSLTIKGDIIAVVRESGTTDDWRDCEFIPPSEQARVTDVTSMKYASKYSPVYTILDNGKINVFPAPGSVPNSFKVYYINNEPARDSDAAILAHDSSDIRFFPRLLVPLVVKYASVKLLHATLAGKTLPDDVVYTPTAVMPSGIDDPNFPYAPPVAALDFSQLNTYIVTEEDSELAQVQLGKIETQLNEYNARMQNSLNEYNEKVSEYQAKSGKYSAEIQKYQVDVNRDLTKYQADLQDYMNKVQKIQADYSWMQGRYVDLQNEYNSAFSVLAPKGAAQGG